MFGEGPKVVWRKFEGVRTLIIAVDNCRRKCRDVWREYGGGKDDV